MIEVTITFEPEEYELLEALAEREGRSVEEVVRRHAEAAVRLGRQWQRERWTQSVIADLHTD